MFKHIEFVEDRPYNDPHYSMDSSKLHHLGWGPKVSWEDGIDETGILMILFQTETQWCTREV